MDVGIYKAGAYHLPRHVYLLLAAVSDGLISRARISEAAHSRNHSLCDGDVTLLQLSSKDIYENCVLKYQVRGLPARCNCDDLFLDLKTVIHKQYPKIRLG